MRKVNAYIVYFSLTFFHEVKAQTNLVPNADFEFFASCPTNIGQINLASPWSNPTGCTPDYFNQCNGNANNVNVPSNVHGIEPARSGNGYAGVYTFLLPNPNVRDYIQIQLNDTLMLGKKYLVEFYVSLADKMQYSANSIGAYFSGTPVIGTGCNLLSLTPQIQNNPTNPLNMKSGWRIITDTLLAQGGELYMTIGNFNDDTNSDTSFLGNGLPNWNFSYYYIDDVSVTEVTNVGMNETINWLYFNLYPNPSSGTLTAKYEFINNERKFMELYDILGHKIMSCELEKEETKIDLLKYSLNEGIYFYKVRSEDKVIISGKIFVTN